MPRKRPFAKVELGRGGVYCTAAWDLGNLTEGERALYLMFKLQMPQLEMRGGSLLRNGHCLVMRRRRDFTQALGAARCLWCGISDQC